MNEEQPSHRTGNPKTALGAKVERSRTMALITRRRQRGQTTILIALAMLALIGMVGLAIDGGAVYQQRRIAQNSADAAALAGTRVMLDRYVRMVADYPDGDVAGSPDDEIAIKNAITDYASRHGIDASALEAYFVDDNKHVVGDGDTLLQVGQFGLVPWTQGAKGISVKNRAQTDSFFMKLFGWTMVGARANSTAFMGPAMDSGSDISMFPIGFFTDTLSYDNMVIGQSYTLIDGDSRIGSGNWGYIDYNQKSGAGSTQINEAWVHCGFNPSATTSQQWVEWATSQGASLGNDCGNYTGRTDAAGPAAMFKCLNASSDPTCSAPEANAISTTYLKFGDGTDGWWLGGSSGSTHSQCDDLAAMLNGTDGYEFNVPMIDKWVGGGSGMRYHLRAIGRFYINSASIDCHVPNGGGGGGEHAHWHVDGTYEGFYLDGATGHHGDLRHASASTVFLDN